ncbi:MAG: 3'-5' exonuclease [bacterium]|nr:3'-5' exonuclease [bacterium]
MKYLFFDTETTGLPLSWKAPVTDLPNWPRVVQLAWALYDGEGVLLDSKDRIIKPDGFEIPVGASNIHGISTERALEEGISRIEALGEFQAALASASHMVAHNMSFDQKVLGAEFLRSDMENVLEAKQAICTKDISTEYCALPGNYGYKWPKLSELHQKLFGEDILDAHNAMVDVNATARCFWELKKRGVV